MKKILSFGLMLLMSVMSWAGKLYFAPSANWQEANAKFAVYYFDGSEAAAWGDFISLAEKQTDIYEFTVPDGYKKIIFGRFSSEAAEPSWTKGDKQLWNQSDDIDLVEGKDLFTMTVTGDKYEKQTGTWSVFGAEPEPAPKFYITGNAALVGEELAWQANAVKVMEDSYTFKNLAAGDYTMKVTKDGTWNEGMVVGYDELTEVAKGITTDNDRNIIFTLAEAGDVVVTYTAEAFTVTGNFYVAPVEETAKFYITGNAALVGEELAWQANAVKVMEDSYTFKNLAAGDYMLKVVVDGNWEGGQIKGYDELTEVAKGITTDNDRNIIFTLAEAGDVVVTYTAEAFTVTGNFYVEPVVEPTMVEIRLVPGIWNVEGVAAKFAAVTWKEGETMFANGVMSDWFVGTDTLVGLIPEDADSIGFARFNGETATPSLNMELIWNHTDMLAIDASMIYTITAWGEHEYSLGYWGMEAPVAKYYLVGDMTDWENGKIEMVDGVATATLSDEGRTYAFKIVRILGEEKTWYGNDGEMTREYHENWTFSQSMESNCRMVADVAGDYTFAYTIDGDNLIVTVTYPNQNPSGIIDIENIKTNNGKVMINGQLYILRDGKMYNMTGALVR
ncbi:MAG: hypothetical protein IJS00_06360 [Paludibacteraceae bacterium]|nr:hypothetical protein [Paludibacteraceae bacterium]